MKTAMQRSNHHASLLDSGPSGKCQQRFTKFLTQFAVKTGASEAPTGWRHIRSSRNSPNGYQAIGTAICHLYRLILNIKLTKLKALPN